MIPGAERAWGFTWDRIFRASFLGAATVLVALGVGGVVAADRLRIACGIGAGLLLLLIGAVAPRRGLLLLVFWLVALGLVRRLVSLFIPEGSVDPILLVEVFALAVLAAAALPSLARLRRSALAVTVLSLQALIALSAFNPAQGGVLVGLAGLLFVLVPTIGFWIGRGLVDEATFLRLVKVVGLLGGPVAAYGLLQVLHGFPTWDAAWIQTRGYDALNVGGSVRPFGPFPSSAEYAAFLAASLLAAVAFALRGRHRYVYVTVSPLVAVAIFLASARAVVFAVAAALAVMGMASRRLPLAWAAIAGVAAVLLVPTVGSRLLPTTTDERTADLVSHQVQGLTDPLDARSSTLSIHLSLVLDGLRASLANPLGVGAGAVTPATKLGGTGGSTEADPSNLGVAVGPLGVLAYLVLVALVFTRAYRLASTRGDPAALAALGLLVVTLLQWFTGGQYAMSLLVWLTIGWVDRASVLGQSAARERPRDLAAGVLVSAGARG